MIEAPDRCVRHELNSADPDDVSQARPSEENAELESEMPAKAPNPIATDSNVVSTVNAFKYFTNFFAVTMWDVQGMRGFSPDGQPIE